MTFTDRRQAGEKLAPKLRELKPVNPVVLAVPRGGVVVAEPVAAALSARIELVIPRKVGAPGNPEIAVAAVAPEGAVFYNHELLRFLGLKETDLAARIAVAREEIAQRMAAYHQQPGLPDFSGMTAVLVDDGVATGFTVLAALAAVKKRNPLRLILAVPVVARDTAAELEAVVDDLVSLLTPADFVAVSQFYRDFAPTTDAEVLRILQNNRRFHGNNKE